MHPIATGDEFAVAEEAALTDSEIGTNPDIDPIAAEIDIDLDSRC